jgi:hypothetical protein
VNPIARLVALLKPQPKTPEEVAAAQEAAGLRDELETIRVSQRWMSGQNYQSGGGSGSRPGS